MAKQFAPTSALLLSVMFQPVYADGLGGLSAVALLIFLLLSFVPLGLLLYAAAARQRGPAAFRTASGLSILAAILYIVWGASILQLPVLVTLNPWWNNDTAIVGSLCLLIIVGNLFLYVRSIPQRSWVLLLTAGVCVVQWVGTPGRSIHFANNPLQGDIITVEVLDPHHIAWGARILRSTEVMTCCGTHRQAVIEQVAPDSYRVMVQQLNSDPRGAQRSSNTSPRWAYRFPLQPRYVAEPLLTHAQLLPHDWVAAGDSLLKAARVNASAEWIHQLARRGADPNHLDLSGRSPLSVASRQGGSLAATLVAVGANPNIKLPGGNNLLHQLAHELPASVRRAAQKLLNAGVNPAATNHLGQTPLEVVEHKLRRTPLDDAETTYANWLAATLRAAASQPP